MKLLTELLTDEERSAIRAPIAQAGTLPRHAFVDEDFYRYEIRHVLSESWVAISFGVLIPKPGDILPLEALGFPILLVRGVDGLVRAFHNVCPYDGCEVSIEPQYGVSSITTPYHGWVYDLSGELVAANYWDGTPQSASVSPKELNANLVRIPCEEWMGTVFVYPGNHPISFSEQYRPVLQHFEAVDLDRLEPGLDREDNPMIHSLSIDSNWKTVYENYSPNVYHESFVHAMYKKSPHSPRVDEDGKKTYTEINDPSGFLGLCYDNSIGSSFYGESKLPKVRNKDGSANTINTISNVFPNWVVTVLGDAARISVFLPSGPERGTQMVATFFDQDGATDRTMLEDREHSTQMGLLARKEDNLICESVQRARHSPAIDRQFYSPFWDAMHYSLSNLVLDRLEEGERREQSSGN